MQSGRPSFHSHSNSAVSYLSLVQSSSFDASLAVREFPLLCFELIWGWGRLFELLCGALVKDNFLPCIFDSMNSHLVMYREELHWMVWPKPSGGETALHEYWSKHSVGTFNVKVSPLTIRSLALRSGGPPGAPRTQGLDAMLMLCSQITAILGRTQAQIDSAGGTGYCSLMSAAKAGTASLPDCVELHRASCTAAQIHTASERIPLPARDKIVLGVTH